MYNIRAVGRMVQEARQLAHLTQRELAERVGTSQSAIAKLEQGDANPTIDTLARCTEAAGLTVQLTLVPLPVADAVVAIYKRDVDRTLLRENLLKSVHERLRSLGEWQADLHGLQHAVTRARSKKVAEARPSPEHKNREKP
ncbi:helix-turn-helix domain-containing protein [Gemmatimonas sp.]|uniref:helix-turn-helix domain-containing protein n=1 Tax=Gemmatimonas sp. TaxID=1962908 RepID=UPI003564F449